MAVNLTIRKNRTIITKFSKGNGSGIQMNISPNDYNKIKNEICELDANEHHKSMKVKDVLNDWIFGGTRSMTVAWHKDKITMESLDIARIQQLAGIKHED